MSKTSSKILNSKTVVTAAELSAYIGISPRSIREHVATGVITRAGPGKYLLKKSVTGYARWLQGRASKRRDDPMEESRARLIGAKATLVERQLKHLNDRYLDRAEVDQTWIEIKQSLRDTLSTIPARVARRLPHLDSHALGVLEEEVRDALKPVDDDDAEKAAAAHA